MLSFALRVKQRNDCIKQRYYVAGTNSRITNPIENNTEYVIKIKDKQKSLETMGRKKRKRKTGYVMV